MSVGGAGQPTQGGGQILQPGLVEPLAQQGLVRVHVINKYLLGVKFLD